MTKKQSAPNHLLRARAEAAVLANRTVIAQMSQDEIQRLVQELQVHQIELQMQNEELRESQAGPAQLLTAGVGSPRLTRGGA